MIQTIFFYLANFDHDILSLALILIQVKLR